MSIKDKFTDEEWQDVVQAPMLAGMAVTAADPGGLWAAIKEGSSMARTLVEAKSNPDPDSLPKIISATLEDSDGRRVTQQNLIGLVKGRKPAEVSSFAVERLREIDALIASKAPEQTEPYRQFVRTTAQNVAEAAKEGGFLGMGGETISDAEKKTLDDIDRALS
jgi:hypothetical protein